MNKTRKIHSTSKTQGSGHIRIIAGKHRGRKLPVLMAEGLRPTTDRVKETVFNWLMPYIHNSNCLDCYAGSGSLGFEALSRGAGTVTFIELNKQAAQQLDKNKTLLKAANIEVIQQESLSFLNQAPKKFDLIFIDPPFRQELVEKTIRGLEQGWLAQDAIVYIEMESENQLQGLSSNWQLLKEKVAGQVAYRLYQYQN